MTKFIAVTAMFFFTWGIGVLTLIYGWGLEPKSWGWIIGAGIFGRFVGEIITLIVKE